MEISLKRLCEAFNKRLDNNYDLVIAFAGINPGVGKTTLAIQTGMMTDPNFTLEKNVAYFPNFDLIKEQFFSFEKKSYFLIDEAIKVLYKLRWMDRLQIKIDEMYALERKRNICTALCIPRFIDLNEQFRNYRVKFWFQIIERGVAIVYTRDEDEHCPDPWHFKENYEMKREYWYKRGRRVADISTEERLQIARNTIGYVTDIKFDALDPEIEKRYIGLLEKHKDEEKNMVEEKREPDVLREREKQRIINYENAIVALFEKGLEPQMIAKTIKADDKNIYRILKKYGKTLRKSKEMENLEPIT
jgi:hypothetical protein